MTGMVTSSINSEGMVEIPLNSIMGKFVGNMLTDKLIGSKDHFLTSRDIIRRPRHGSCPVKGIDPAMIVVREDPESQAYHPLIKIEVSTLRGIIPERVTQIIDELTLEDVEVLFEGLGKALLKYKYGADIR